jgi:DNA-binding transcriptional LysR family regulator
MIKTIERMIDGIKPNERARSRIRTYNYGEKNVAWMIENRHLRYFVALAETLHMTRASEQLHLAQPSLSQNIQQLEEELGTTLIRRTGHKLSLTDAGEIFLVEARKSLQQFELAKMAAQKAGRGELGEIALAFNSAAGVHFIPRLVSAFRKSFPDVRIRLSEMNTDAQLAALRSGDIDLAFAYALPDPEFQYRELTPESLVAVLPNFHPRAAEESVSLKELAADALILPSAVIVRDAVLAACADEGFSPKSVQEINTIETAIGMVAAGLGVSILPTSVRQLARDGIVILPIRNARVEVRLLALWKRDDISLRVQNFLRGL